MFSEKECWFSQKIHLNDHRASNGYILTISQACWVRRWIFCPSYLTYDLLFLPPTPPALPRCLSPLSACWRTTTSTAASSASCCQWAPPSTWMARPSTKRWLQYLSLKSTTMSWTLARSSPSGQSTNHLCFWADTRQWWCWWWQPPVSALNVTFYISL